MKKILFLISNLDLSGGARVVSSLSFSFSKKADVVTCAFRSETGYSYGGRVIFLNIDHKKSFIGKIFSFVKAFVAFRKILKKESPDWVITVGHFPAFIASISAKNVLVRLETCFFNDRKSFYDRLYLFLFLFVFRKAVKVVAVSEQIKKEALKIYPGLSAKISVIVNPIDLADIDELKKQPLAEEFRQAFNGPVIVNVGNFVKGKGQDHLIRAFKILKDDFKDLSLVLIGNGGLGESLRKLINELDLNDSVFVNGWQKNPFAFMAKSKIFVSSSLSEGFGLSIVEAMACALPIVAIDCPVGPREILAPKSADYIKKGIDFAEYGLMTAMPEQSVGGFSEQEKEMASAIRLLLEDKNLYLHYKQKSLDRSADYDLKKISSCWQFLWE